MKLRSCFVSNSSSSSFIVRGITSDEMKERVVQCCKDYILASKPISEQEMQGVQIGAEKQARQFANDESKIQFFDVGESIGKHKMAKAVDKMARFTYASTDRIAEVLDQQFVFPDSKDKIAVMIDSENAFYIGFDWAERNGNEDRSIMEALAESLDVQPTRLT